MTKDITALVALLAEAKRHHTHYELNTDRFHDWQDYYAAYIVARQAGGTEAGAATFAATHIDVQEQASLCGKGATA